MTDIKEVQKALLLLPDNLDCFALEDLKDSGSPCIDWFNLSVDEQQKYVITKASAEMLMPKYSDLFRKMERSLAQSTGSNWVTYDWSIKTIARAITFCNFNEFYQMLTLSRAVKFGMKQRDLDTISSIEEAFA